MALFWKMNDFSPNLRIEHTFWDFIDRYVIFEAEITPLFSKRNSAYIARLNFLWDYHQVNSPLKEIVFFSSPSIRCDKLYSYTSHHDRYQIFCIWPDASQPQTWPDIQVQFFTHYVWKSSLFETLAPVKGHFFYSCVYIAHKICGV